MWTNLRSLNIGKPRSTNTFPVISVDELNKHYSSVSSIRNPDIIAANIESYSLVTPARDVSDKFFFKYVLPCDIVKAINGIKSNATGIDSIPVSFLKLCLPSLLPVIEYLFNYSLQNSIFPSMWKQANIVPIPKVKNPKRE